MGGPQFAAVLLFLGAVGLAALLDIMLHHGLDREALLLLAGGAAPVAAFALAGLAQRRSGLARPGRRGAARSR